MYPIKFKKILIEKVWGGRALEDTLDIKLPNEELYGESWEVTSHGKEISIVESGMYRGETLQTLLDTYKEEFVGKDVYEKYGNQFPLLIKYLDINDKLSVQVHPNDEYALKHENDLGKTESWYVIDASSDAKLIMGVKEGISKESFEEKVKNSDFSGLFNEISVKKGDFININPGMVHASLEGSILICEPQQNSDSTYRIYDFDRVVNGDKRPLHLKKAIDVIDFSAKIQLSSQEERKKEFIGKSSIEKLTCNEYFKVDKLNVSEIYREGSYNNFIVYSALEGFGEILCNEKIYSIKKGETYFIPPNLELEIHGTLEILKTYI